MTRIPITMCHGIDEAKQRAPLTADHFERLIKVAADLGFESINYDDLEAWRSNRGTLPRKPIMIDFDHPVRSMRYEVNDVLDRYGFKGNLFVNTGPMGPNYHGKLHDKEWMTWEEVGQLVEMGWFIGAHTVNHPNLSKLSLEDPDGQKLREELRQCDETIEKELGIKPKAFAFTGTSFSTIALEEVKTRYRFGRLWITQAYYQVDGAKIRYADLVGVTGEDEPDGGPPQQARYIYRDSDPYLLPSMEFQALIYQPEDFRAYLEAALPDDQAN